MRLVHRIATWWKAVTRPEQLNSEMEDELAFHIEAYANDLMRSGLPREEAFRRARAELGGLAAQKENCRAAWGTRAWDELRADLRYAIRMLAKSPSFTTIAICSLALGIGANTIIFTVTKSILLDRLAVPHPEELRLFALTQGDKGVVHGSWGYYDETPSGKTLITSFSYPVYQQLRQHNHVLQDIFAFKNYGRMTATIDNKAEVITSQMVSGNYYRDLGVRPLLGRSIVETDDGAVGSGPVMLISYGYWSRRFGRSPNVIGKKIEVNSTPMTIIGVNPPDFTGVYEVQSSPDIFLPFSMQPIVAPKFSASLLTDRNLWWVMMMGRLKLGISPETARAALDVDLSDAVRATMTVGKNDEIPRLELQDGRRGQNEIGGELGKPVYVLTSLAAFVLLLACANLANLLLARASSRQREMSVRLALGAGRARILRQMLTESLLLSLAGGVAGLLLGYYARNAIPHLLSSSWEAPAINAKFNWMIFAFTAAISIFTGLLFGLAPAWQATRTQVSSGLKDNAQMATQRKRNVTGKTLVVIQVTLSMLLLVGAGLFVRTLTNLNNTHMGFSPDHIVLFDLQLPPTRYPNGKGVPLYHQMEEKLTALQGVDSVAPLQVPLISHNISGHSFDPDDQPSTTNSQHVSFNAVGQHFFSTFNIPIIAGRGFNERDTETSSKVAVINQTLANKFFPKISPVGRTFRTGDPAHPQRVVIIGICQDAKYDDLRRDAPPTFYALYRQQEDAEFMTFAVHTHMKPEAIVPSLRSTVASVDKDLPLQDIRTQNEQIEDTTRQERIFASLTSGFGILALVLACIGIYGIMAYTVARRTNEIGIRMALGAQAGRVLRMILREASWMAIVGIVVGLSAAVAMGRLIASMLFGLKPYDPLTLGMAALLLALVALAASLVPAWRAAHVDPIRALRHE
ncbi:ABC transporter permease [Alloacidobacterium dinghuense]|uniref:ABC transporter permease n=1 Tax=Alloacidobacterium dinghuense TaxID=2763107 RepID=A0A7G8BMH4_9BACT|nr:ABC transporter permease [Alloacidobacterium dinghuense]QNI33744.1 ABC transporter permease [Alloacidobacterium dinghuense]